MMFLVKNSAVDISKSHRDLYCIVSWSEISNFKVSVSKLKVISSGKTSKIIVLITTFLKNLN